MACLIDIQKEEEIYSPEFFIDVKRNECDLPAPNALDWYIGDDNNVYKIAFDDQCEAQSMFLNVIKNNQSILSNCCFHKDFFKISSIKSVAIGNINLSLHNRKKGIVKKIFNRQRKIYFQLGFNYVLLNSFVESSFIWYKLGFKFVDEMDKQYINKLLKEFLVTKGFNAFDIIKMNLDNIKQMHLEGFREFLEKQNIAKSIPMYQKVS
ncbi:hypothetical protein [Nautilia lithotrophica]